MDVCVNNYGGGASVDHTTPGHVILCGGWSFFFAPSQSSLGQSDTHNVQIPSLVPLCLTLSDVFLMRWGGR